MGFSGRLEGIAPSDIFQIISQSRMTGTLIARCQEGTAMVVFKNGQVIEAASDAQRESLSHLLVVQGLMSDETIGSARDRRKREPDRPLGAILIEMGAISEQTLEAVVLRQIGHIVHRLVACEDGFFTFDSGEMALKRKLNTREFYLPSGVSTEYLMMERARALDEERRSGADRRTHAPGPSAETVPPRETIRAERERARSASPEALHRFLSRLKALRLPGRERLRSAAGTIVRTGGAIARSAGDLVRRTAAPRLEAARLRVRAFSPDGRALIIAGIAAIAAAAALLAMTAPAFRTAGSELVVTGRVVNLRAGPTIASKVVAKAMQGDTLAALSFAQGWHKVRTKTGGTAWIWQSLVKRKGNTGPVELLGRAGFGLLLVAGLVLLVTGIRWKRGAAQGTR